MISENFLIFIEEAKERFKHDDAILSVIEDMERDIAKIKGSALTLSVLLNGGYHEEVNKND